MSSSSNKRIAKNTILLYARTLVVLAIKLYSSRLILDCLGVSDYGIYNVVGAFVAMFTLFNGALSVSIQRFITFSIGQGQEEHARDILSVSLLILLGLSAIIVLFGETAGLWYVNNIMELPTNRLTATNWVYQFSLCTFVLEILTIPYNAVLTAYENFKVFAYFDILNAVLSLLLILGLFYIESDRLIAYGLGVMIIAAIIRILYSLYSNRLYKVSKFHLVRNKALFRQLFSFSFYSFFGTLGVVLGEGGINIVINYFFGVTVNATRGVSTQVSNAVGGLVRSFITALSPQITKSYAENDMVMCTNLVYQSAKFSFLLYSVLIVPVFVNIHWILSKWLTVIPPQTEIFIRLMLIQSLIHILFNPITALVNATGNIKKYQIGTFSILVSNICFVSLVYICGADAYWGIAVQCIVTLIQLIFSLFEMQKVSKISAFAFFKQSILPSLIIFVVSLCLSMYLAYIINNAMMSIMTSLAIIIIMTTVFGLSSMQRQSLISQIKINKIWN